MRKEMFVSLLIVIFFHFVSADVVSINSGGNNQIIINPDVYFDMFFSGDIQILSSCGNGVLETPYEQCDDGNYVSGDGCSATCQTEGSEPPPEEPPEEGPSGPPAVSIRVNPTEIKRGMLVNSNLDVNLIITNLNNNSSANFLVYAYDFDPNLIVLFWDARGMQWAHSFNLTLSPAQIYNLTVRFSSPNIIRNYTGYLAVGGRRVGVNLTVQEKLLLFDSNIIVLNEGYVIPSGDKLRTSVTLIPLGDKERMDVTLNYVIKDYEGRIYLTRSETVLVENQINFRRNFDIGFLPTGGYIIGLELIYPNGVAPPSAYFEVEGERQNTFFGKFVFFLVNIVLIILILLIILIVLRIIKQLGESRKKEEKEKVIKSIKEKEGIKDNEREGKIR